MSPEELFNNCVEFRGASGRPVFLNASTRYLIATDLNMPAMRSLLGRFREVQLKWLWRSFYAPTGRLNAGGHSQLLGTEGYVTTVKERLKYFEPKRCC